MVVYQNYGMSWEKEKGEGGITRLMAICITRGPDSPQRARALIRDHDVDVRATDDQGRIALHHALGARYDSYDRGMAPDHWPDKTPINIENADVVSKSYPDFWEDLKKIGFEISEI